MPNTTSRWTAGAWLVLVAMLCAWGSARSGRGSVPTTSTQPIVGRAELRSWIVLGRGRHMYLDVQCTPPYEELSGRIEFTSVMLRSDYRYTRDETGRPRVGRMRGGRIVPPAIAGPPDNRYEAVYELTLEQVRNLQRDRIFDAEYVLVGPNSNAAMRRAITDCGLVLPERVARGGGMMGEFPGVEFDVGAEIEPERWPGFGVVPAP